MMTMGRGVIALATLGLAACAEPPRGPLVLTGSLPTEGAQGTSALVAACPGMDGSRGLALLGRTLWDIEATVRDENGNPVLRAWAPAHRGESRSTRVERLPGAGPVSCEGTSLRTSVVPDRDGELLRWELEMGTPSPGGVRVSVFRGEVRAEGNAFGQSVPVVVEGRRMTLRVSAQRGAAGLSEDARVPRSEGRVSRATPLPDERAGRTLEEMREDAARRAAQRGM